MPKFNPYNIHSSSHSKPKQTKRVLLNRYGESMTCEDNKMAKGAIVNCRKVSTAVKRENVLNDGSDLSAFEIFYNKPRKEVVGSNSSGTWVQCDVCGNWQKLYDRSTLNTAAAWFGRMNNDPLHQHYCAPQASWNTKARTICLFGFYTKKAEPSKGQNISTLTNVLKGQFILFNSDTNKALSWLVNLPQTKFQEMEESGVAQQIVVEPGEACTRETHGYLNLFHAADLLRKFEYGRILWFCPFSLDNLAFDSTALKNALTKPQNLSRLYLSKPTIIVVPSSLVFHHLVYHWIDQFRKNVSHGQQCFHVQTHNRKPSAHSLAWIYGIFITTFNKLSAEWSPRRRSVLMQVLWPRTMLDEGRTPDSSCSLTNNCKWLTGLILILSHF